MKEVTSSFMELAECVAAIMYYQCREEKLFMDRVFKLTVTHDSKYDIEMSRLANIVSKHASELVFDQYSYAMSGARHNYSEPVPEMILMQYVSTDEDALDEYSQQHAINKRNWECSCLFMTTHLLPCRYFFFLRRALKCETIIPMQHLHPRWLLSSVRAKFGVASCPSQPFAVKKVVKKSGNAAWDSNRKYREALRVASTIGDTMRSFGMQDYRVALRALHQVAQLFKHRKFAGIAGLPQPSVLDEEDYDSDRNGKDAAVPLHRDVQPDAVWCGRTSY